METNTNPELELAYNFIQHTKQNIFLTGKAGTGKTTFLRRIKAESIKKTAVVAPTGIAAINAKGVTIHSLFQLPFGPLVPGAPRKVSKYKISKKKISLIKSLDLLIIDEISMVRADVLDGIDDVLRRYKNRHKPFGGVQLLMIGDLHQLPPVVKSSDWEMLREHYTTAYFFGSNALKMTNPITIQLTHIYRQSDEVFIRLLNKVRDNQLDVEVLNMLNSRYIPNFQPAEEEGYITLTSHNRTAYAINDEKLKSLPQSVHKFKAVVKGDFPANSYPNEETLEFKVGAQVLFIKNDSSGEKAYYNGKIGKITAFTKEGILVKCPNDREAIEVKPVDWRNLQYSLDVNNELVEEEKGVFIQYPLKLAWAITIHKSQGLTFEKAIIDAQAAFAHGQVYVALSRCKSFEGIVLRSPIGYASVKTDIVVKDYSEEAKQNAPDEIQLEQSKQAYQQELIEELFSFNAIRNAVQSVGRIYYEYEKNLTTEALEQFRAWEGKITKTILLIANKFQLEIQQYFSQSILPEENEKLQTRIEKAGMYFVQKIKGELAPSLQQLPTSTDNKEVTKKANDAVDALLKMLFIKNACLNTLKSGFSVPLYLKTRTNAGLDFEHQKKNKVRVKPSLPANIPHPHLYLQLLNWREREAQQNSLTFYDVLPTNAIKELVTYLPTQMEVLKKIKGIGAVKVKNYGEIIIKLIETYCQKHAIKGNLLLPNDLNATKITQRKDPRQITFDYFKAGNTLEEIAKQRGLTLTTVQGHLGYYILHGQINIYELLEEEKIEEIQQFFKTKETPLISEGQAYFGKKYSYADLKMVMDYLNSNIAQKKTVNNSYFEIGNTSSTLSVGHSLQSKNPNTSLKDKPILTPTKTLRENVDKQTFSVEKIRETYPNAYMPWKEVDETQLLKLRKEGKTIREISTIMGRKRGAISSRLKQIRERKEIVRESKSW